VRRWRKGSPCALFLAMGTRAATMGNSVEFPQKHKNVTCETSSVVLENSEGSQELGPVMT